MLPDGTQWDRQSGEEFGPNGYWFRWHRLRGKSGKVCPLRSRRVPASCPPHSASMAGFVAWAAASTGDRQSLTAEKTKTDKWVPGC